MKRLAIHQHPQLDANLVWQHLQVQLQQRQSVSGGARKLDLGKTPAMLLLRSRHYEITLIVISTDVQSVHSETSVFFDIQNGACARICFCSVQELQQGHCLNL